VLRGCAEVFSIFHKLPHETGLGIFAIDNDLFANFWVWYIRPNAAARLLRRPDVSSDLIFYPRSFSVLDNQSVSYSHTTDWSSYPLQILQALSLAYKTIGTIGPRIQSWSLLSRDRFGAMRTDRSPIFCHHRFVWTWWLSILSSQVPGNMRTCQEEEAINGLCSSPPEISGLATLQGTIC
jgi:hypothetical protein